MSKSWQLKSVKLLVVCTLARCYAVGADWDTKNKTIINFTGNICACAGKRPTYKAC